jgi:hypothetical protein
MLLQSLLDLLAGAEDEEAGFELFDLCELPDLCALVDLFEFEDLYEPAFAGRLKPLVVVAAVVALGASTGLFNSGLDSLDRDYLVR